MREAIYQFSLDSGSLNELKVCWEEIAQYMMNQPQGALSSTLYYSAALLHK